MDWSYKKDKRKISEEHAEFSELNRENCRRFKKQFDEIRRGEKVKAKLILVLLNSQLKNFEQSKLNKSDGCIQFKYKLFQN